VLPFKNLPYPVNEIGLKELPRVWFYSVWCVSCSLHFTVRQRVLIAYSTLPALVFHLLTSYRLTPPQTYSSDTEPCSRRLRYGSLEPASSFISLSSSSPVAVVYASYLGLLIRLHYFAIAAIRHSFARLCHSTIKAHLQRRIFRIHRISCVFWT